MGRKEGQNNFSVRMKKEILKIKGRFSVQFFVLLFFFHNGIYNVRIGMTGWKVIPPPEKKS